MEKSIYKTVCGIVAGHELRRKKLEAELAEARDTLKGFSEVHVSGGEQLSPSESAAIKVEKINKSLRAKYVFAVEQAKSNIIFDYSFDENYANRLIKAIILSCEQRYTYNHTALNRLLNLNLSYRSFYRSKADFIEDIADILQLA